MNEEDRKSAQPCRTCLSLSETVFTIFQTCVDNVEILEMLKFFSIEVNKDDGLPKMICYACLMQLQGAYKFISTCKKSQAILDREPVDKNSPEPVKESYNSESDVLNIRDPSDEIEETEEKIFIEYESYDQDSQSCDTFKEETDVAPKTIESISDTVACPLCPRLFKAMRGLRCHLSKHTEAIQCKTCAVIFDDATSYITHYKSYHKYICEACNRPFSRRDIFMRHMQSHNNTLPNYKCPVDNCTRIFMGKQALKNHCLTVHSEQRNYLCSYCGADFKNYDNLRYHIKKHEGPSFVCTYCGQAFIMLVHLKFHMWRHTGVKPYKCINCDKGFLAKKKMLTHMEKNCPKSNMA